MMIISRGSLGLPLAIITVMAISTIRVSVTVMIIPGLSICLPLAILSSWLLSWLWPWIRPPWILWQEGGRCRARVLSSRLRTLLWWIWPSRLLWQEGGRGCPWILSSWIFSWLWLWWIWPSWLWIPWLISNIYLFLFKIQPQPLELVGIYSTETPTWKKKYKNP